MFRTVLVVLGLVVAGQSSAAQVTSGWFQVAEISSDGNGPVAMTPSVANSDCPQYTVWVGQSGMVAEGYRNAVATMLAAHAAGYQVKVDYESSTAACYVYRLRLKK